MLFAKPRKPSSSPVKKKEKKVAQRKENEKPVPQGTRSSARLQGKKRGRYE